MTGCTTFSYAYNEANQLSTVTTVTTTASYTYDGDGLRATATTTTGTAHDTWNQATPVPLLLTDGTNDYLYRPDGTPIEQIDSTGTITGTATYDPYGTLATSTGTLSPLGYDGQYTDPATGLIYLRARYYDPATAAFLTPDPLVDTTHQPYEYADDDPINNGDPLGQSCWNPFSHDSCFAGIEHVAVSAEKQVAHWATTASDLPNSRFITGALNVGIGVYKVQLGIDLIVAGSAADVTGFGSILGIPAQAYGGYQLITGISRTGRGAKQLISASQQPMVCKSPLRYAEDIGLDFAPGGGGIENLLGGLP